jgi:hypothetical protein
MGLFPVNGKNPYYERKRRKNGPDQPDEDQQQTEKRSGTAFQVDSKFNRIVKNFTPINERLYVIRIKGRFFNYSLINIHAPTNDSEEEDMDQVMKQSW